MSPSRARCYIIKQKASLLLPLSTQLKSARKDVFLLCWPSLLCKLNGLSSNKFVRAASGLISKNPRSYTCASAILNAVISNLMSKGWGGRPRESIQDPLRKQY